MTAVPASSRIFGGIQGQWIVLFLIISAAVRLSALILAWGTAPYGDPDNYLRLAHYLLAGDGLSLPRSIGAEPIPTGLFPPALPLLLAVVGLIAPLNALTLCILNTMIDCAAALMLARLARLIGAERAAVPAALAYLIWPSIAFMSPLAYKEGLVIALLLATTVAIVEQARQPGYRWAVMSGLGAGALLLTQPALLTFLPILFVALCPQFEGWRHWWITSLVAASVTLVVMLPWWIRNVLVFGEFIPLTTSGGLALWVGVQPDGGVVWQALPKSWGRVSELEANRMAAADAWRIIQSDPLGYLGRCLVKFPGSFFYSNWAIDQLLLAKNQRWPWLIQSTPLRFGPTLFELWAVATAMIGLVRFRRHPAALLLAACFAQVMLFGIWFEFSERHRLYMTPFFLLLAGVLLRCQTFPNQRPSSTTV
jgi:hypothetical protein